MIEMSNNSKYKDILKDDPFGLLKNNKVNKNQELEKNSLVSSFEEIVCFVEENKREPHADIKNINEYRLHARLKSIRNDPSKVQELKKYDLLGLLSGQDIKEMPLEKLISKDPNGLLKQDEFNKDIFTFKHVKKSQRISPNYLSRRKVCENFDQYSDMFSVLHQDLDSGRRRLVKYKSNDLSNNKFYCLGGVLLYLDKINGKKDINFYTSGIRERFDGRTLCIFDNGTESDMLFRSLDKSLQLDGYSISDEIAHGNNNQEINENDIENGFIYVLKSNNKNVKNINDLYKIGYTKGSVSERIKNAKNESTYLFDSVEVAATFKCFNLHSYNLEQNLHDFFSSVKLDIELLDADKKLYKPKEWFQVPINCIEDAINIILEGEIQNYTYEGKLKEIIKNNI